MRLPWVLLVALAVAAAASSVCRVPGCQCAGAEARCDLHAQQVLDLGPGSVSDDVAELRVVGGRTVRLQRGAVTSALRLLSVEASGDVVVRGGGVARLSAHARLRIRDCASAVLEARALAADGADANVVSVELVRVGHALLHPGAIPSLLNFTAFAVPAMQLMSGAFSLQPGTFGRHGPATTITLQNVLLPELPEHAFPSPAAEIRLVASEVRAVRRDAFSAISLLAVRVVNSSLHSVETGAFNSRTLVEQLHFDGARVRSVAFGALTAAVTNLTIHRSSITELAAGAVNATVATVSITDTEFTVIQRGGLTLRGWNRLLMERNTFSVLEGGAISSHPATGPVAYQFSLQGNRFDSLGSQALNFVADAIDNVQPTTIAGNQFSGVCNCDLRSWLRDQVLGTETASDVLFDTSFCGVTELLARCFKVEQGLLSMANFTELVCSADAIVCQDRTSIGVDQQVSIADEHSEKRVFALIFAAAVVAVITIILVTAAMWLRRKGYCLRMVILLLPSTHSCRAFFASLLRNDASTAPTSPIHVPAAASEYAELDVREDVCTYEDKWTQTLPEELTQELLQSLREKLDDPDNCQEARDMIEHLYDLIKVEECCGGTAPLSFDELLTDDEQDDNTYELIRPRAGRRETCSVGTRAPSPDKLLPYPGLRARQPVLCEYGDPRDRQQHVYSELPARPTSYLRVLGDNVPPGRSKLLCDYTEPSDTPVHVYCEVLSNRMLNRPLPDKPPDRDSGEGSSASSN